MIQEPHSPRKISRVVTNLTHVSSDWSVLSKNLWLVDVRVSHSLRAHSDSALTTIYYYKMNVIMNVIVLLNNDIVYYLI